MGTRKRRKTTRRRKGRRNYKMYSPTGIEYKRQFDPENDNINIDDFKNNPCADIFNKNIMYRCKGCDGREDEFLLTDIEPGQGICYQNKCLDAEGWRQAARVNRSGQAKLWNGELKDSYYFLMGRDRYTNTSICMNNIKENREKFMKKKPNATRYDILVNSFNHCINYFKKTRELYYSLLNEENSGRVRADEESGLYKREDFNKYKRYGPLVGA